MHLEEFLSLLFSFFFVCNKYAKLIYGYKDTNVAKQTKHVIMSNTVCSRFPSFTFMESQTYIQKKLGMHLFEVRNVFRCCKQAGYRYIIDWNTKVTLSRILYIRKA